MRITLFLCPVLQPANRSLLFETLRNDQLDPIALHAHHHIVSQVGHDGFFQVLLRLLQRVSAQAALLHVGPVLLQGPHRGQVVQVRRAQARGGDDATRDGGLAVGGVHRVADVVQRVGDHLAQHPHEALRGGVPARAGHGQQRLLPVGIHVGRGLQVDLADPVVSAKPQPAVEIGHHGLHHAQGLLHQQAQPQRGALVQPGLPGKVFRRVPRRRHAAGIAVDHEFIRYQTLSLQSVWR